MVERNMCNAVMRGIAVPPGSKSTSRAKGSRRKLGYPTSGRRLRVRSRVRRSASGIDVAAAFSVVNAIAVANGEAALAAVCPDRVLDEPGKGLRKRWIELPSIDPLGDGLNDVARSRRAGSRPHHTGGSR